MYKDIILGALIGVLYNVFVQKSSNMLFEDMDYDTRYQTTLVISFLMGIVGIALAFTVFNKGSRAIKYGFIFGGILLLLHSMVTNWETMNDGTQLVIFGLVFAGLIFYCYNSDSGETKVSKPIKPTKSDKKVNVINK